MLEEKGIFYIASGPKYFDEACRAIRRTREVMPEIPIAFCTDQTTGIPAAADYYIPLKQPQFNFADKVCNYAASPFKKTVFLDTDTYLVDPIDPLFVLLNAFDVAAPHAPIEEDEFVILPNSFPEPNSGVIAYVNSPKVQKMFLLYQYHFLNSLNQNKLRGILDIPPDQPSFRYAVYNSDVRFTFLPHEYNCMIDYPTFLSGRVHLLHGHCSDDVFAKKEAQINAYEDMRLYSPLCGLCGK